MKKKSLFITSAIIFCLMFNLEATSMAASNGIYNSRGKIVFNNNTSDISDDVIFDAKDLTTVDTTITNGKARLAESLNAYPNKNVASLDTFANLATAIDTLTNVPDIYYYNKATEGDNCTRYIYEDGSYYPCNEYGVKISDTALSGTVTVVTKDNTTEPSAGEIQLVKYKEAEDNNISSGYAGHAAISLIIGSGADNIKYWNEGYSKGYADGQNNTGEIIYNYHSHGDGYCNKVPVYHTHVSACSCGGYGEKRGYGATVPNACWIGIYCNKCNTQLAYACRAEDWSYADGNWHDIVNMTSAQAANYKCYKVKCGKGPSTIEGYECDIDSTTIISATIVYK